MKLTLHIESDNAEMRTSEHAASVLSQVSMLIRSGREGGKIRDVNGNTVGSWSLKDAETDDDVSRPSLDDLDDDESEEDDEDDDS